MAPGSESTQGRVSAAAAKKKMASRRRGELEGARGAAGLRLSFKDIHLRAALREDDRGGEAVGSGTDDAGSANHGLTRRLSRNSPRPENSVCGVQGFCNCVSPPMQYKGRTRQSKVLRKFPEAALTARLRRGGRLFYTHSFVSRKGPTCELFCGFCFGSSELLWLSGAELFGGSCTGHCRSWMKPRRCRACKRK